MAGHGRGQAGALVRRYRREAGLTQRQLADVAAVSVGVIRDIEQGQTSRLHDKSVRRLISALRLDRQRAVQLSREARGEVGEATLERQTGRSDGLRISVLGPLAAWRDGVPVRLGPPMQRALLGLLALYPETGLARPAIIDTLWADAPPVTAVSMVQSYISRLHRLLGPGGPVNRAGTGYQLEPAACELDLNTFSELVSRAREARAAGEFVMACQAYADALALWRGDPLADCDILLGHPAVAQLSQQHADAVTGHAEAATAAGYPDHALPHLRQLAVREPLNERAHALLMIALAGSGRQGAALHVYDQLRRRLDDELGIRPGAELAAAHAQVLNQQIPARQAPGLAAASGAPAHSAGQEVPRQLPSAVAHFAGRAAELAVLDNLLAQAPGGTILISAIAGTAGVGKTALAVQWAHQAADRFTDGQLYVNLRGYDTDQPMSAADALARFLRALGVAGQDIPVEEDERAARYRSLLAGRRMLVVLDNARSAEQIRPLLPGTPACTVVVTSRDALAGLVARDGAIRLDLDLLPLADAVNLLQALIGARVDTDRDAAEALAGLCSCLPLALRVAAEIASARSATPLTELVSELTDQQRRLDLLDAGGDPRTAVRAVFSWSYRHLDANAARAFRQAGLHPGPDFDSYAVAALIGATLDQGGRVLDVLARAHLIQQAEPGRYGMHDLLRAYACELGPAHDGEDEGRAALTRLFDYYLHTAVVAMDTLFPADRYRRPRNPAPAASAPTVTVAASARGWLDTERTALVAVAAHAADRGWPGHAIRLADTLYRYLIWGNHAPEAHIIHTSALRAARETGDRAAEAAALTSLGAFDLVQDRHQQAADRFRQAVDLSRGVGDQPGEARAVLSLGWIDVYLGCHQQAADRFRQAVDLSREAHDRFGESRALSWLGTVDVLLGRYQRATDLLQQALASCRLTGDQNGEGYTLTRLGQVDVHEGRYREAADHHRQAVDIFREIGDRAGEAQALTYLGETDVQLGQYLQAIGHHKQAADMYREINNQAGMAKALNGLGKAHLAAVQPIDARIQHTTALGLASRIGRRFEQARAHDGLAHTWQALGDHSRARRHWQQALDLYISLGSPEAKEVRVQLAMAGTQVHHQP